MIPIRKYTTVRSCTILGSHTVPERGFISFYHVLQNSETLHNAQPAYLCRTAPKGHAIAQAVSCWLPTAATRVRGQVWSNGICGGQSGAGVGILRVLRFPELHSTKFSILTITRGRHNRPVSGRRAEWTQFGLPAPTMQIYIKQGS
jgi:hypothetical protein